MSYLIPVVSVVLCALLAAETVGRAKQVSRWLIGRAVRRLPQAYRTRLEEEWLAHLADCPGPIAQLSHAVGCYLSSRRRRPFDMSLEEACRLRIFAVFGQLAVFYSRYCRIKAAAIFGGAFLCSVFGRPKLQKRMSFSAAELYRLALIIERAGRFAQVTREFAYIKSADTDLTRRMKMIFVQYAFSSTCFYFKAVIKKERYVYALRNCYGANFTLPKRTVEAVFDSWAAQRTPSQRQMGSLKALMLEFALKKKD